MQKSPLGSSPLMVSRLCLGSMTWGSQNTAEEAFSQIDYALDHGINFIDTAELYPTTPSAAETSGGTERIIGAWLERSGRRGEVVLATKIAGAGNRTVRPDGAPIGPATLRTALDGSLKRLKTDHVDLYQLHWPNRGSYHFRRNWTFDPTRQPDGQAEEFHAILETLAGFVAAGKVRHVGLSNESAFGLATCLELARRHGLPRIVSLQNEYSLLHRIFDLDLAEMCHHEHVGLMAYSPLAAGLLSGKYEDGIVPPGSRASINPTLFGRRSAASAPVVTAYVALARQHGLDPAQMALAFCMSRPFMASTIIGATSMRQLATDVAAAELKLSAEVMEGIAAIHRRHPIPL